VKTDLTTSDEDRLLTATKRAADLVERDGLAPNAAIEKVARDGKFGPGEIEMLCYAHNTGRQLAQFQKTANVLDKLAEFPLADPAKVVAAVYPTVPAEKAAVAPRPVGSRHLDYLMPPTWADAQRPPGLEKAALDLPPLPKPDLPPPDPHDAMRKKYGDYERVKLAHDQARQAALLAEGDLHAKVAAVTGYFQQPGRLPFDTVEKTATALYGADATALMDLVHVRTRSREKRAAATPNDVVRDTVSLGAKIFHDIGDALAATRTLLTKRAAADQARAAFEAAKEGVTGPFAAGRSGATAPGRPTTSEKRAILNSPAFGAFLGNSVGRIVGDGPKSKNDLIEDEWLDLEDPGHQNELRKIKAHAMLNGMLTDPDSPISGHDPDEVLQAYNEISSLAPRVAEQPAAIRPILARKLQGNVQPFEAKEVTDIEKGIASTRASTPNTSLLKDAPESLLG
jgi:hypothetical protein